MKQVAEGVYQVSGYVNAFLIDGDDGVTVVDTGLPGKEGAVASALGEIGRNLDEIGSIVVTHGHADHYGSAAVLKTQSGAKLVASEGDAPILRGHNPPPPPPFVAEKYRFLAPIIRLLPDPDAVEVDIALDRDGPVPVVNDLAVIHTPGHTEGHISLLLDRSGGILFVGDAATADKSGNVKRGFMNVANETFDASLRKLASLEFETALFGHSAPISRGASGAFRRWAESTS